MKKAAQSNPLNQLDSLLRSLVTIQGVSNAGYTQEHLQIIGEEILRSACSIMGSPRGSMMIYNDKTDTLDIVAAKGLSADTISKTQLRPGEGVAGMVYKTGQLLISASPDKNPNYRTFPGLPEHTESFVSVPVKNRGKVLGVLNIHSPNKEEINSQYHLAMLNILADKAALTIENMNLYRLMGDFNLKMVETLTRVIDAKDSYTHDHADRARVKARRIAEAMKLPPEQAGQVEFAALLHDIGKIGIKESILLKPGQLTDEEYLEIKRHPEIGYQILWPIETLRNVAQMVLCHQEWYNGSGYPAGIAGTEIPLGSRIVSTIDAWDAMVSDRPYRKALPRDFAIKQLRAGCGKQFDPTVVEVFLQLEKTEWVSETVH